MGLAMVPRDFAPASPQDWKPAPEPLEGPGELLYERIVRLEWDCGIRSGTINDWYRDVGQAQAVDLELRRARDREHARAGDRTMGRLGPGRTGGRWQRTG